VVQTRVKATVARIDALLKHQKNIAKLEEKQIAPNVVKAKASAARHTLWLIAREKVLVSRIVRELKYTPLERKRLLDKVNKTVTRCARWSGRFALWTRSTRLRRAMN